MPCVPDFFTRYSCHLRLRSQHRLHESHSALVVVYAFGLLYYFQQSTSNLQVRHQLS